MQNQARRQDFPAGGSKTTRGAHFKYNIGCMQQPGVQTGIGGKDFKQVVRAPLSPPLRTALYKTLL